MEFDYTSIYERYWLSEFQTAEADTPSTLAAAEEIAVVCGAGPLLDIGCGRGTLVRAFLRLGIDACGVDVSTACITEGNARAPGRFRVGSVMKLPFDDGKFETVVCVDTLQHLRPEDVPGALREIRRVCRRNFFLEISTASDDAGLHRTVESRAWWEAHCFEAGLRKHPAYYRLSPYESLQTDGSRIRLLLEPIPDAALDAFPLDALLRERDLHMDMLRETGARSDAHVVRYDWATRFIRPGDAVLDAACGLGYGSYLVQSLSESSTTIGIDESGFAVRYASSSFAGVVDRLEFSEGSLPKCLSRFPDDSFDVVLSFETLEHVEDPAALLTEFHRILKPSGRLICSVPNDWTDESGKDPNPFHLQVYDLQRLKSELETLFLIEHVAVQSASREKRGPPGARRWEVAARKLHPLSLAAERTPDAEWWLAIAAKSPFEGTRDSYVETTYPTFDRGNWNATAFKRDYRNPWLVRTMVSTAHRLVDTAALVSLANQALLEMPAGSNDAAASLCVLGYRLLEDDRTTFEQVRSFDHRCSVLLASPPPDPHGIRWSVSLLVILGRLWLRTGDFPRAASLLQRCVRIDVLGYSPLLANRTVEACILLGQISLQSGTTRSATKWWRKGILLARDALAADWREALGNLANPADFALPEMASLLEHASTCGFALAHLRGYGSKRSWWMNLLRRDRLKQIQLLNSELDRQRRELSAYAEQAGQFDLAVGSRRTELDAAYEQLKTQRDDLERYAAQSVGLLQAERQLRAELAAAYAQIEAQRSGLQRYAEQAVELLESSRKAQDELSAAYGQIEAQRTDLEAYAAQTSRLLDQERRLQQQLADAREAGESARHKLSETELELAGSERAASGLRRDLSNLQKQRQRELTDARFLARQWLRTLLGRGTR